MAVKKSSKGLQNLKHEVNVKENVKAPNKKSKNEKKHSDCLQTDSTNNNVNLSKMCKKKVSEMKDHQEEKKSEGIKNQPKKRNREEATIRVTEEPQSKKQKIVMTANDRNDNSDDEELQVTSSKDTNGTKPTANNPKYLTCKDATVKRDLLLKQQRDKRCLVVKNLNADTTAEDLQVASSDLVEVRVQIMKSKKAEGRKLAFLEFHDELSCKQNLESVRNHLSALQEEAVVELAEKDKVLSTNLAFDPLRLFVKGFEPGCHKSEIETIFPSSISVDGVFNKEDDKLENDHVVVAFSNAKESSRVKSMPVTFRGCDLHMEFLRAGKRQCRRAAKKAIKNEQRKKRKKSKDDKSEKGQKNSEQPNKRFKLPKNSQKSGKGEEGKLRLKSEKSKEVQTKRAGNENRKP